MSKWGLLNVEKGDGKDNTLPVAVTMMTVNAIQFSFGPQERKSYRTADNLFLYKRAQKQMQGAGEGKGRTKKSRCSSFFFFPPLLPFTPRDPTTVHPLLLPTLDHEESRIVPLPSWRVLVLKDEIIKGNKPERNDRSLIFPRRKTPSQTTPRNAIHNHDRGRTIPKG